MHKSRHLRLTDEASAILDRIPYCLPVIHHAAFVSEAILLLGPRYGLRPGEKGPPSFLGADPRDVERAGAFLDIAGRNAARAEAAVDALAADAPLPDDAPPKLRARSERKADAAAREAGEARAAFERALSGHSRALVTAGRATPCVSQGRDTIALPARGIDGRPGYYVRDSRGNLIYHADLPPETPRG